MAEATTPDLLSLPELRAALAERDTRLGDRRLKRLRAEGLLRCEGQSHRAGLRGSESTYPRSSVEQLELVARLAATERRFAQLRILVRWHDGWVDPDLLRASLVEIADGASAHARRLAAGSGDAGDQADRLVRAMRRSPGRGAMTRLVRKRLGNVAADTERVSYALAALTTGAELAWENHDPNDPTEPLIEVFDRASGFDRARRDRVAGQSPLLGEDESTQDILAQLQAAGCFDLLDLARAFRDASEEELDEAFADAHSLVGLGLALEAVQAVGGHDVAGLASLSAIGGELDAWNVVMLVRSFLLLRPIVPAGALEAIVQAADKHRPSFEIGLAIRRELPQHADFIGPNGADRLNALDPVERARVTAEIRGYVESQPRLKGLMAELPS